MIFRPALRFLTGPFPPGVSAARLLAASILPPLLFFATLEFTPLVVMPLALRMQRKTEDERKHEEHYEHHYQYLGDVHREARYSLRAEYVREESYDQEYDRESKQYWYCPPSPITCLRASVNKGEVFFVFRCNCVEVYPGVPGET